MTDPRKSIAPDLLLFDESSSCGPLSNAKRFRKETLLLGRPARAACPTLRAIESDPRKVIKDDFAQEHARTSAGWMSGCWASHEVRVLQQQQRSLNRA